MVGGKHLGAVASLHQVRCNSLFLSVYLVATTSLTTTKVLIVELNGHEVGGLLGYRRLDVAFVDGNLVLQVTLP